MDKDYVESIALAENWFLNGDMSQTMGQFRQFSDGRFVGVMLDLEKIIDSKKRSLPETDLVFGFRSKNFLKFCRFFSQYHLGSRLYKLRVPREEYNEDEYVGSWIDFDDLSKVSIANGFDDVENCSAVMDASSLTDIKSQLDILSGITKEVIEYYTTIGDSYIDPDTHRDKFRLRLLESLSAEDFNRFFLESRKLPSTRLRY